MAVGNKQFTKRGIARFPKTDQPYTYSQAAKKSIPDPEGKMSLEVVFSATDAEPIIANVKAFAKESGLSFAKVKNWPWKDELEKDTDEPTGNIILKFGQGGKRQDGTRHYITHVDATAKPLPRSFKLTGGSEVIVSYRPHSYTTLGGGVNLYLDAVQITKYREYTPDHGFDKHDDGFAYQGDAEGEDNGFGNESEANGRVEETSNTDF